MVFICVNVSVQRLLVFLVVLSLSPQAMAQTFYVAPNGNDQAAGGSAQNPWATITFALDQVSDGAEILVAPGTYLGRVRLDRSFSIPVTIRSETPYQARLQRDGGSVVTCFACAGIILEGFDISHAPNNTGALVIQIQGNTTTNVVVRNNVIHDSTNNDLLKINNGAQNVLVEGNLFYTQAGTDEHIDINSTIGVVVQDNVFFNTEAQSATSSYIVIKDSNGGSDGIVGTKDTTVRRNVFLNWQGSSGQGFLRVGEDNTSNFEADGVLAENNLMIGNSRTLMRSSFTVQGSRNINFRHNTVVGDLPSRAFAARLLRGTNNQANQQITFSNNIWSDPDGSMGLEGFLGSDVFEALSGSTSSVELDCNLYFNGGNAIPADTSQEVRFEQDSCSNMTDPGLPAQTNVQLPILTGNGFADGSATIREVFMSLVNQFGIPNSTSVVIDAAGSNNSPMDDITGAARDARADIGAFEVLNGGTPNTPGSEASLLPAWLLLLLDE